MSISVGIVNGVNPHYFNLIAGAKGITSAPQDGAVMYVNGRDSEGDGFEGNFYWDATSTDDTYADAISIKATSITTGRWVRIFSGLPHVTWWVGSNDADVDQDFTDALAYCAANNIKLYVPNGTYALTANIWDAQDNDLGLIGESRGAIITFKPAVAGTTLFKIRGTRWEFANLRFQGDVAQDPRKGIIFELGDRDTTTELDRSSFRNIWFEDLKAAFYADYTWVLTISDCWFQRCESGMFTDANGSVAANSIGFSNCHAESTASYDNHAGVKGFYSGLAWEGGVVEGYTGSGSIGFDIYAPSKGISIRPNFWEDNTTDVALGTTQISGYVTNVHVGPAKGGNRITMDYAKNVAIQNTQRTDTNAARPMLASANTKDVYVRGLVDSAWIGNICESGDASTTLGIKKEAGREQVYNSAVWADWIQWDISTVADADYIDLEDEIQMDLYDSNYTRTAETTEYVTGSQSMKLTRADLNNDARSAIFWLVQASAIAKLPRKFCFVAWIYNPSSAPQDIIVCRVVARAVNSNFHTIDRTVQSPSLYQDYWMPIHVEIDLDYLESQITAFDSWSRISFGFRPQSGQTDYFLIDHVAILPGMEPGNTAAPAVGSLTVGSLGNNDVGAWQTPSLLNSWANYNNGYQTARYRRVGDTVEIEGAIVSGVTTTVFELPTGYRPSSHQRMSVYSVGATKAVDVQTDGTVAVDTTSVGTYVTLNCRFML